MKKTYKQYFTIQNITIFILLIAVIVLFYILLVFIASQESFNADVALEIFELQTSQ